jgi:NAD(P)-dependent dehydrogenase (short-subunit alcohol dehydrogenase family)
MSARTRLALPQKTAIVTGASSGIGRATALLFAAEGANVVVAARRAPELEALVAEIIATGGEAAALAGDVRDANYAESLVALALHRFGGLDIAFNNAATMGRVAPVAELSVEDFRHTIETNLTCAFIAAKAQIPALIERRGSLIFTSSFVGHTAGFPGLGAYGASKAGLVGLTQVLAAELGPRGVRVNALLPGATDTPMAREFAHTPEIRNFIANLYALKRIAEPAEIARAALFLASEASSFVTGTAMLVDGGVSINRT